MPASETMAAHPYAAPCTSRNTAQPTTHRDLHDVPTLHSPSPFLTPGKDLKDLLTHGFALALYMRIASEEVFTSRYAKGPTTGTAPAQHEICMSAQGWMEGRHPFHRVGLKVDF